MGQVKKKRRKKKVDPRHMEPTTAKHVREQTADPTWLLFHIQSIETALAGRWAWWIERLIDGELGDHQIPQLKFAHIPSQANGTPYDARFKDIVGHPADIKKQFLKVVNRARLEGIGLATLLDWFLYGLEPAGKIERPKLPDDIEVAMYQDGVQALCRMLAVPGDWAADITCELFDGGKSGTAWFPTPGSVTEIMNAMTFGPGDHRAKSVNDPCCGTGVMLIYASNHCLDISGQDIDPLMVKWCMLQGYLYVPWMVYGDKNSIKEIRENRAKNAAKVVKRKKGRRKPAKRAKLKRKS